MVPVLASPALLDVTLSASETVTVPASADAQVLSNFADRNYGSGIRLRSQAKPGQRHESLLRFVLPALSGEIRDARLRLYVRDGSPNGGVVRRVVGSWTERFVTWKTRPRLATTTIGRIHATGSPGHWITVPLRLNGLHSGQTVDLAIVGASTNGAWFASSETATGPRLLLTIVGPASTTGPTPTPTGAATRAPTAAPTSRPGGAPTSIPTSAPTSHPTSAPTGAPTSAPTAAPPGGTIAVPSSIDSTGATDASAKLNAFLATVPDGSTIAFRAGATYLMDAPLKFSRRHNLTFDGRGATLKANGPTTESGSLIWVGSYGGANTGITIHDFTLVGHSTTPGVYQGGKEGAHGVLIAGSNDVDVYDVTVSAVWGDCFYVGGWADTVRFHDSTCQSNGRNGVTITSGRNVTIQHVAFPKNGYVVLDIEPNLSSEGASNIKFLDNTAGTWSDTFFSALGAPGSVIDGVTVSGNTLTSKSLRTHVTLARRQNIVFTNNTSTVAAAGPVLQFAHVDGLTVTGNVQPLTSGQLASISDCTGVTYP